MNRNIVLTVSYDGSSYLGWQKTDAGASVEASLEKAIEAILNHPVHLQAASRTDAGVHAEGQIVNFFTGIAIDLIKFFGGINALLPKDIIVTHIEEKEASFHPTLDCLEKEYHYRICHSSVAQPPLQRAFVWHVPSALNLQEMEKAATMLIGTHDFEAFCNLRRNVVYASYIREVSSIKIQSLSPTQLLIKVSGRNFLYKMVRNIVGTLVYIGRGKLSCDAIPVMLEKRDRKLVGVSAPAHGLCLKKVLYKKRQTTLRSLQRHNKKRT